MEIAIKWSYNPKPGTTLMDIVRWDDVYGINNRSSYKFGVEVAGELLTGQDAYDYIINNGRLDLFPTFHKPEAKIFNPEWQEGQSWEFRYIPNPNYPVEQEAWNAAIATMNDIMHSLLRLTCMVTFPYVQDVGNGIKWYKKNIWWREIPVEPGKYPLRHTRVIIRNEPEHPQYSVYMSYVTSCGTDKEQMLKILLGMQAQYIPPVNVVTEPEQTIG